MKKTRLLLLLALLMTAATGARAAWTGGTYTATATENLGAITVNGDATLTINSDVTVTVTGGINVASGTLTVTGPGTLVVNGAKGNDGNSDFDGGPGGTGGVAISGNIIVQGGATVTATGGTGGTGGNGEWDGGTGGNGGVAFAGTLTYKSGTVTANGGSAGSGGWSDDEERYASSGSAGKAFANDVDFTQTTGYSVTNGTSTIGSVLNQTKVVISGGTEPAAATTYTVSLKDGVKDADKWQGKAGEGAYQALPLEGVAAGTAVTIQYSGTRRVKSVKAVKVEVIPVGAIKGKFTINNTGKQVYFAKGNLQAVCTSADNNPSSPETFTWQFAENQWDCVGNNAANNSIDGNGSVSAAGTVDLFGWSTAATTYGIHNSTTASVYSGDFVDWGGIIGTGWRTLTKDEWNYLFMTRESGSKVNGMSPSPDNARYTHATINTDNGTGGIRGMILFPDGVTVNYSDATSWGGINQYSNWNGSTKCTTSQWNALAAKGFVFLPTGGVRNGTKISNSNNNGYYWSSYTASPTSGYAHYTRVVPTTEPTTDSDSRKIGISVRLVYEVATTDAPAAAKTLAEVTAGDIGKIVGKDGKIYATKADAEAVATGNAVAMIAYVGTASDCTHGLAIALADESGTKTYGDAGTACSGKEAVTGGTWRLPSIKDWQYMLIGCGASGSYSDNPNQMSCSELASKLNTAQGDALQTGYYWSSTEASTEYAWTVYFGGDYAPFYDVWEGFEYRVRACLAF